MRKNWEKEESELIGMTYEEMLRGIIQMEKDMYQIPEGKIKIEDVLFEAIENLYLDTMDEFDGYDEDEMDPDIDDYDLDDFSDEFDDEFDDKDLPFTDDKNSNVIHPFGPSEEEAEMGEVKPEFIEMTTAYAVASKYVFHETMFLENNMDDEDEDEDIEWDVNLGFQALSSEEVQQHEEMVASILYTLKGEVGEDKLLSMDNASLTDEENYLMTMLHLLDALEYDETYPFHADAGDVKRLILSYVDIVEDDNLEDYIRGDEH